MVAHRKSPMMPPEQPSGYMWGLWLLYLVTALVVTLLYFACRWSAKKKASSTSRFVRLL